MAIRANREFKRLIEPLIWYTRGRQKRSVEVAALQKQHWESRSRLPIAVSREPAASQKQTETKRDKSDGKVERIDNIERWANCNPLITEIYIVRSLYIYNCICIPKWLHSLRKHFYGCLSVEFWRQLITPQQYLMRSYEFLINVRN